MQQFPVQHPWTCKTRFALGYDYHVLVRLFAARLIGWFAFACVVFDWLLPGLPCLFVCRCFEGVCLFVCFTNNILWLFQLSRLLVRLHADMTSLPAALLLAVHWIRVYLMSGCQTMCYRLLTLFVCRVFHVCGAVGVCCMLRVFPTVFSPGAIRDTLQTVRADFQLRNDEGASPTVPRRAKLGWEQVMRPNTATVTTQYRQLIIYTASWFLSGGYLHLRFNTSYGLNCPNLIRTHQF